MLFINIEMGQMLVIGEGPTCATVSFVEKKGSEVKVGVDADRSIPVRVVDAKSKSRRTEPWAQGLTKK